MILPVVGLSRIFEDYVIRAKITWRVSALELFVANSACGVFAETFLQHFVAVEDFVSKRVAYIDDFIDAFEYSKDLVEQAACLSSVIFGIGDFFLTVGRVLILFCPFSIRGQ